MVLWTSGRQHLLLYRRDPLSTVLPSSAISVVGENFPKHTMADSSLVLQSLNSSRRLYRTRTSRIPSHLEINNTGQHLCHHARYAISSSDDGSKWKRCAQHRRAATLGTWISRVNKTRPTTANHIQFEGRATGNSRRCATEGLCIVRFTTSIHKLRSHDEGERRLAFRRCRQQGRTLKRAFMQTGPLWFSEGHFDQACSAVTVLRVILR
nr:hypothetical protein CFP56_63973 [Quercus suber]